jgi:membrane protein
MTNPCLSLESLSSMGKECKGDWRNMQIEEMKTKLKRIELLIKIALKKWWGKDPFKESAVIAYYALFSLPGLLVLMIAIAGYLFGTEAIHNHVTTQLSAAFGSDSAKQIQSMLSAVSDSKHSVWAASIGVITILLGATGVFTQLQKSLNGIWEVKADHSKPGIRTLVRVRFFSFGLILTIAFIMLVSLMATTLLIAGADWISSHFSNTLLAMFQIVNFIASRLIIALLFAFMFKYIPDAKIAWKQVWLGSIITAILFLFGMYGLSLYIGKANPGGGYGAAGTILLILVWLSYSALIVLYGAEFTHAYAEMEDGYVSSDKNAAREAKR